MCVKYLDYFLLLFPLILVSRIANAELIFTSQNIDHEIYATSDYFLSSQLDYHYKGIGTTWPFQNTKHNRDCTISPVNATGNYI
jgi:hypothetical protein